jgi:hypothetical protein
MRMGMHRADGTGLEFHANLHDIFTVRKDLAADTASEIFKRNLVKECVFVVFH